MINALDLLRHRLSGMPSGMSPEAIPSPPDQAPLNSLLDALGRGQQVPQAPLNLEDEILSPAEREMLGMASQGQSLPAWLPEAVRRSIMERPSWSEGETPPHPPSIEPLAKYGPQRDQPLFEEIMGGRQFMAEGNPVAEGQWPARPPVIAGPLNQMMPSGRRPPWALY